MGKINCLGLEKKLRSLNKKKDKAQPKLQNVF